MLEGRLRFADGWTLWEDVDGPHATGTLFTTSNGHVGVRPGIDEPLRSAGAVVLVNGVHETRPYAHAESAFGFPENYQTILPVTTPSFVLVVGGEEVGDGGQWRERHRILDLRTGSVATEGRWTSAAGHQVVVRSRRFTSLVEPSVCQLEVAVEPVDRATGVEVSLVLDANTSIRTFPEEPEALGLAYGRVLVPAGAVARGRAFGLVHVTGHSGRAVACGAATWGPGEHPADVEPDQASRCHRGEAAPGEPVVVAARVAWVEGGNELAGALLEEAVGLADRDHASLEEQRAVLDRFWEAAAVDLPGAPEIEGAVRFSMFQLLQASLHNAERAAPAKGLTGQGYQGHHLWDQEIYVDQALSWTAPEVARALVGFRCRTLPQARERARRMSHEGAQFPWRTIDGTEASAFFPAGAAQHHVNADVAWAIELYAGCAGDDELLAACGVEVLVETARLWMTLGHVGRDGRFRIASVTGPDEYTALVDDNLYTNLMAAANLQVAADRLDWLRAHDDAAHQRLVDAVGLDPGEPAAWRSAASSIHLPFDEQLGVHGQDETFLRKPRWDLAATPHDRFPLQDHHHLLTLYRHQVLKQADVVLALFLQRSRFSPEQRRRDFDYYEPLTSHDSSLSCAIHAVVAADVGRLETAWKYTCDAALVDLDDRHGTLADGIHMAAAAGAWLAVACGFGGLRLEGGTPSFAPRPLPVQGGCRFRVRFRGRSLQVTIDEGRATYELVDGEPLTVLHEGSPVALDLLPVTLDLAPT